MARAMPDQYILAQGKFTVLIMHVRLGVARGRDPVHTMSCGDVCQRVRQVLAMCDQHILAQEKFTVLIMQIGLSVEGGRDHVHTKSCGDVCQRVRHLHILRQWELVEPRQHFV